MPSFCPKCGDHVDLDVCGKCGESAVATKIQSWKDPIKSAGSSGEGYIPSAFVAAARLQQNLGITSAPPPPRREKATALYDFAPQDPDTQLRLRKGDELEVIRKDSDGWWFVLKGGEKGLVPGSYVRVEAPIVDALDPAILAAREASNQRFLQWRRSSGGADSRPSDERESMASTASNNTASLGPSEPGQVDARANDPNEDKPKVVRRLRKCFACKETILGRTKTAKDEIFHEICLLCRGCRESIEEGDDYTIIKKKAYHTECAEEVIHCRMCDKEILGRVYKTAGSSFHKLCMVCSQCSKQAVENGAVLENGALVCNACVNERKRKEDEAKAAAKAAEEARLAAEKAAEEARLAEQRAAEAKAEEERAAAARAAEEQAEALRAAEERAAEAKAAEARAAEAKAAEEKAAKLAEEAARLSVQNEAESRGSKEDRRGSVVNGTSSFVNATDARFSSSGLDEFDLGATGDEGHRNDRLSAGTDLDFENDYGESFTSLSGERDSLRLSQVIDVNAVEEFNSSGYSSRHGNDRLSTLSDLSNISENEGLDTSRIGEGGRPHYPSMLEGTICENEEDDDDRELCGGCGAVLEGEAVGALNRYFHYECFKCGHCSKIISEDDGYAEKDNMAFHQQCYQARFGKRCCRCDKVLKGKVVKALDSLYHPDCFVCYQCNSSLSESFFEHNSQAVCARCKHVAITSSAVDVPDSMTAISVGTVGYHFVAQDETQLTISPGQQVSILQKDEDGWWFVDLHGQRGYVPGSYLIEHPTPAPRSSGAKSTTSQAAVAPKAKEEPPPQAAATPGLCSECGTQNPDVARFCRRCGNQLLG